MKATETVDPTALGDIDLTPLREKGVQVLRNFFPAEMKADFARRAREIVEKREAGKLTYDSQDSQGLSHDWFTPILHFPPIIDVATSLLGPDVCGAGWRILVKDKFFRNEVSIHQDWPYNPGDTRKITMFVPLTRVNRANGGLIFFEESHLYGPQSRGALDPSRFPPMDEVCPDVEAGDLILCDFLTWHYSLPPEIDAERIMIQLNYQPASDASGDYLVAGKFPHNRRHTLPSRFEAVTAPSVDVNLPFARRFFEEGDAARAERYAKGLLYDDRDHVGAALLMCELLDAKNDLAALTYLEQARAGLRKLQRELAAWDAKFGLTAEEPETVSTAAPAPAEGTGVGWSRIEPLLYGQMGTRPHFSEYPATLTTPSDEWGYGAISDLVEVSEPTVFRVRARAIDGKIGFCLINADYSLASEQFFITPDSGDATVMIPFTPEGKSAVRLVVRNYGDPGRTGKVVINDICLRA